MLKICFLYLLPFMCIGQQAFSSLDPSEFELALRKNQTSTLLDLRDIESYEKGHIKNAKLVDFLRDDFKEYILGKYALDAPLYIYDQTANASQNAALYLAEIGFTHIKVLNGGFENWIKKSKPYKSVSNTFTPLRFVTKENFFQILKVKKWVLVVFYDGYCVECDRMENIFNELKAENQNLHITKIDFTSNVELAEWQAINKSPTLVLYKEGIQYWKTTGETSKQKILDHIY